MEFASTSVSLSLRLTQLFDIGVDSLIKRQGSVVRRFVNEFLETACAPIGASASPRRARFRVGFRLCEVSESATNDYRGYGIGRQLRVMDIS